MAPYHDLEIHVPLVLPFDSYIRFLVYCFIGRGQGRLRARRAAVLGSVVNYTNLKKYKNSLTAYLASAFFLSQGSYLGLRPFLRSTCAAYHFIFLRNRSQITPTNKPKKVLSPLAVGGGHRGQRRPAVEVTEVMEVICEDRRPFGGQNARTAKFCTGDQASSAPSRPPNPPNGGLFQETPRRTPTARVLVPGSGVP